MHIYTPGDEQYCREDEGRGGSPRSSRRKVQCYHRERHPPPHLRVPALTTQPLPRHRHTERASSFTNGHPEPQPNGGCSSPVTSLTEEYLSLTTAVLLPPPFSLPSVLSNTRLMPIPTPLQLPQPLSLTHFLPSHTHSSSLSHLSLSSQRRSPPHTDTSAHCHRQREGY